MKINQDQALSTGKRAEHPRNLIACRRSLLEDSRISNSTQALRCESRKSAQLIHRSVMEFYRGSAHCRRPPAESRIFGFWDFSEIVDFGNFPLGFGVWGGLQSIGNGCGLQIDGFSAHIEPYGSIFEDFNDFGLFSVVCRLFRTVPETMKMSRCCLGRSWTCLEGSWDCLRGSKALSRGVLGVLGWFLGLSEEKPPTGRNWSGLVGTSRS